MLMLEERVANRTVGLQQKHPAILQLMEVMQQP